MRMISVGEATARIEVAEDELVMLGNALNEVCNALGTEFSTRMGVRREDALKLLGEIHGLLGMTERKVSD